MSPSERKLRLYRFCRLICLAFLKIYNRYETRGKEHVPAEGGCIIVSNHASIMDPPAMGCAPRHRIVRFMARDTLYKLGFIRWLFLEFATVPISRDKGDVGALKKALHVLKEGGCLGLFPEGTRTKDGNLQQAKGGIGFLIAKAGVPVVPVYIHGTFEAFNRYAKFIHPAKIRVRYGTPVTPAEIAALGEGRDVYEKAAALVMARIASLREELLREIGASPR